MCVRNRRSITRSLRLGLAAVGAAAVVAVLCVGAAIGPARAATLDIRSAAYTGPAASVLDAGPGGPIAIVTCPGDPTGGYYGEILRTEGFSEFTTMSLTDVTAESLAPFDTVVLAKCTLSGQEATFINWVSAGGNLIAMRPDRSLASLVGLQWPQSGTLSDAYLKVDPNSAPAAGVTTETLQFHGTADTWGLNGAKAVAWLYSDANTITSPNRPAVTLRSFGGNGGQAAAFTYDLARSVIQTHQGNPAWAGDERDFAAGGQELIRSDDLFYGAKPGDVQPDWVNLGKVQIPQADEQQRLLANLITEMTLDRKPLPRFWYLPNGDKAAIVMTGDDHGNGGTAGQFDRFKAESPANCSVADWECIRSTSYVYPGTSVPGAKQYQDDGFEISLHLSTGCQNYTPGSLAADWDAQLPAFESAYPGIAAPTTNRTHCIPWSDWASVPKTELAHGVRLDTNYYFFPPDWINDRPGMMTGAGIPMRFADTDGSLIDVYQAPTEMTDESGQSYPYTVDTLLDNALGPKGYYGTFTANMHTDNPTHPSADAIVASAKARGVPVISARQLLSWLDARNSAAFGDISYGFGQLRFTVEDPGGARGLQAMLPVNAPAGTLQSVARDGTKVTTTTRTIKGIDYAFLAAAPGSYVASYVTDTTPPAISNVAAEAKADGTATVTWTTDEPATSRVYYGTSADALTSEKGADDAVSDHTVTLTGLTPASTYFYRVSSTDTSSNASTFPSLAQSPATFTAPAGALVDTNTSEFAAGNADNTYAGDSGVSPGDGEIQLKPALSEEFNGTSLPTDWMTNVWNTGGSASVTGGALVVDGASAGTAATFAAPRTLEYAATLADTPFQSTGLAVDYNDQPWAMFSTGGGNLPLGLYSRSAAGSAAINTPAGKPASAPHRYRIEWTASGIGYYLDGVKVSSDPIQIGSELRPLFSDFDAGSPGASVAWMRMSPYATTGTFTSRVFDSGTADPVWQMLDADAVIPTGTAISFQTRSGDTPQPDTGWSAWQPVGPEGSIASPAHRYLQYRADLSTTDTALTPTLERVAASYSAIANGAPTAGQVALTPRTPTTNQTVTAAATGFADPDGDQLTMHFRWLRNGAVVTGENAQTLDLSAAGNGDHGDAIAVEVYATDGRGGTSATVSDSVIVANTTPTIGAVELAPSAPGRHETLHATPSGFGDADGDTLAYHYRWLSNGTELIGQTAATLDLPAAGVAAGDEITVEVRADDGNGAVSDPARATVKVTTTATLVDSTTANFAAGTADGTYAGDSGASAGDGELQLTPAISEEFSGTALPADWATSVWNDGGTATVTGGALIVDGASAGPAATFAAPRTLEWVGTFGAGPFQHGGLGIDYNNPPWAMFSTGGGDLPLSLYARTAVAMPGTDTPTGQQASSPHRFRIEWTASGVDYYLDGAKVATNATAINAALRPLFSDLTPGGPSVSVAWMRMSPYGMNGVFTSRVLDAQSEADWQTLDTAMTTPTGTSASFETRAGNSPQPDATWSEWQPVAADGSIASPNHRYIQYRATLSTDDAMRTPTIDRVTIKLREADNSAPAAGTVTLTPVAPTTNQTLTATAAGFSDPDGDALTYHYQWLLNGQPIDGATAPTLDLSAAGHGDRGDKISVQVTADDGHGGTSAVASDQVTVANSVPLKGTAEIAPPNPTTSQTLTATAAGFSDPDGDALTYHYQWLLNGQPISGATAPTLDLSVPGHGAAGDTVAVEVSAADGHGASSPVAGDQVKIAAINAPPETGTVNITPTGPTTNQTLSAATAGFRDPEGDQLIYHYQWLRNAAPIAGANGSTLDLSAGGNGDRGDVIGVEIYATDGRGANSAKATDQVTVANAAPTAGSVRITPAAPKPTAVVSAVPSGFGDSDGDALSYQYRWSLNGKAVADATGSGLDLSRKVHAKDGDAVSVEVIALDPHGGRSAAAVNRVKVKAPPLTLSLRTLAASGLRVTVNVPPRTRVLDLALYRATGPRNAVLRGRVAVTRAGRITIRWTPNPRAVARLRAGSYVLLVHSGRDPRHLSTISARITIRLTGTPVKPGTQKRPATAVMVPPHVDLTSLRLSLLHP